MTDTPSEWDADVPGDVQGLFEADPDCAFNLANDLVNLPVEVTVRALFELAIRHNVVEAYLNYGNYLEQLGDLAGARQQWAEAHRSGDPKGALYLAWDSEDNGALEEALEWYQRAAAEAGSALGHARTLRRLGRDEDAFKLLQDRSSIPEVAVELAHDYGDRLGDGGLSLLEQHHRAGDLSVAIPLANLYEEAGRSDEAINLLRSSYAAGEPFAAFNLGRLLVIQGHGDEGTRLIHEAATAGDGLAIDWLANDRS